MAMGKIAGSIIGGLAVLFACSANDGKQSQLGPTGGGSGTTSGGTSGQGGSGARPGGAGGGFLLDSGGLSDAPAGDAPCQAVSEEAKTSLQPADIIWAVDTSGSMIDEAAAVQNSINAFSQQIVASGIDVHVVMTRRLSDLRFGLSASPAICVAPPLGTGQCMPVGAGLEAAELLSPSERGREQRRRRSGARAVNSRATAKCSGPEP